MTPADETSCAPDRALRVLQVSLWLTPRGEGIQTYLRSLLQAFETSATVCFSAAALYPGAASAQFGNRAHLGAAQSAWRNALRLAGHLGRSVGGVDVVHVHGALQWPLVFTAVACRLRRVSWVVSPHGQLTQWFLHAGRPRRRWFARWVAVPLMRRAAAVLATTQWEADQIRLVIPDASVVIVPPGVTAPAVGGSLPVAGEPLRVVFVGQFNRQKGLPTLLEAMAQLPDARLLLLGKATEPGFEAALRAQVRALGLEGRVEFLGYRVGDAKWAVLAGAHVFALPSQMENFSFATAEALAAGVPAVVSTEVALAETIDRHGCGTTVPLGDAAALARALRPYGDVAFRQERAGRAARCAREEFAPAVMRERLEALYAAAAARRGRSRA